LQQQGPQPRHPAAQAPAFSLTAPPNPQLPGSGKTTIADGLLPQPASGAAAPVKLQVLSSDRIKAQNVGAA